MTVYDSYFSFERSEGFLFGFYCYLYLFEADYIKKVDKKVFVCLGFMVYQPS